MSEGMYSTSSIESIPLKRDDEQEKHDLRFQL